MTAMDLGLRQEQMEQFKGGMDFETFRADSKTQSAMIHQFLLPSEPATCFASRTTLRGPQNIR